jgi:outer membrane lipoprotein-sorting protein
MRKIAILMITMLCTFCYGQTAKSVLDKAAAAVSNKSGVSADFTMTGLNGTTHGTIVVKGKKFHATTPQASIWFDGKTQWTYMKKNDEVNISTPTHAQLQAINPYNFINMYKQGFQYTMNNTGKEYVVHLTASDKSRKIQELFINVDKKNYTPTQVKMLQGKKWITFVISNLKKTNAADATFRFSSKDFPTAEVIDLR